MLLAARKGSFNCSDFTRVQKSRAGEGSYLGLTQWLRAALRTQVSAVLRVLWLPSQRCHTMSCSQLCPEEKQSIISFLSLFIWNLNQTKPNQQNLAKTKNQKTNPPFLFPKVPRMSCWPSMGHIAARQTGTAGAWPHRPGRGR